MSTTRRTFIAATAAATTAAALTAKPLKTIGVQLYTLRNVLPKDPLSVLKAVEAAGFREAEVIGGQMDLVWDALRQTQLKPVSLHLDTLLFTRNQDKLGPALDDAVKRGFKYVVCPYIAPADRGGVEVIKKLAETLNSAGAKCTKAGVQLAYHNHAFEFEPAKGEKGTLLDVLLENCDKKHVVLELDMMWAKVAGLDPAEVVAKYGSRIHLMHLKDLAKGTAQRYNEGIAKEEFKEVGSGSIDVPKVLQAAAKAGVKHYFVEQDQTPGNPVESLKTSFAYLAKL